MIRSLAGCARRFSRRVWRHRCRTAGLSSETRRPLIRRGSWIQRVSPIPGRPVPGVRASARDVRFSAVSARLEFLEVLPFPRRRSALPRCVSTARPCVGEGGVGAGAAVSARAPVIDRAPSPSSSPARLGKRSHLRKLRNPRIGSPSGALPPYAGFLNPTVFRRNFILFRGTDRAQVERGNFTPNSRRWIRIANGNGSPTYFQIASVRRYKGRPIGTAIGPPRHGLAPPTRRDPPRRSCGLLASYASR